MSIVFEEDFESEAIQNIADSDRKPRIPLMSAFLIRIGLVRNAHAALYVLIGIIIVCTGLAAVIFTSTFFIAVPQGNMASSQSTTTLP